MTSQIDIANRALLSIGARAQISTFSPSDGSVEADAISVLWQPTFEQLGRAAPWNCLTRQVTLSLIQAAKGTPENPDGTILPLPPSPWLYTYAHPVDCLLFRFIVPSLPSGTSSTPDTTINNSAATWIPNSGQIPFAVSTILNASNQPVSVILSNQGQAQAVYNTSLNNPNFWDSLFQAAMVASLGAYLVPALSLSMPLMGLAIKTADAAIARARAQDGNEGVTSMDHTPDWIRARAGGGGFPYAYGTSTWGGYCNMLWPSDGSGSYGY